MAVGQPQRQLNMQQYGSQPQGPAMQPPQFQQQPPMQGQGMLGMQQNNAPQGQAVPPGGGYNPSAPGMQQGNPAPQHGNPQGLSYDPHNPQIAGGTPSPGDGCLNSVDF